MTDSTSVVHEPWPSLERQREGVSFGLWVFIASEILFFGGLFAAYAVYRYSYPEAFQTAARETEIVYGTANTAILLTSSLTMAVAVEATERKLRRLAVMCLAATALFGMAFLIVKGFEYYGDIEKGLWPGASFSLNPPETRLFWTLYWIMTGIHGVHLIVGIGAVTTLTLLLGFRSIPPKATTFEGVALYWHLVDLIWVILLPLLYLVGRA